VSEDATAKFTKPGEGFPPGFEYRWTDNASGKTTRVSAPEYVDNVVTWIDAQMGSFFCNTHARTHAPCLGDGADTAAAAAPGLTAANATADDPRIFPVSEADPFPADFHSHYAKDMFKRLFRILAIIYSSHADKIKALDAAAHLNTVFKHFLFFCIAFNMLEDQEMKALKPLCDRFIDEYKTSA